MSGRKESFNCGLGLLKYGTTMTILMKAIRGRTRNFEGLLKKPEFQLSPWGRKLPKGGTDEIQAMKQNNCVYSKKTDFLKTK